MAKYNDPFGGIGDIYKEITKHDDILKGSDPFREMRASAAVAESLYRREADLAAIAATKELVSTELERERRFQASVSLWPELDVTRQIKDLLAMTRASGVDKIAWESARLGFSESLAQALVEPVPSHLAGWVRTAAEAYASADSYRVNSVLERLTGASDIAFATRIVEAPDKRKRTEKTSEERKTEGDSFGEAQADEREVVEPPQDYSELALPEEVRRRLQLVEYIPIEIHHRIARNQKMLYELSPRQFEEYVADLLKGLDFEDIVLTPQSGDGGRDLVATKRFQGIPLIFAFECKKYKPDHLVGPQIMRALLGTVQGRNTTANKGVLVTTSYFTKASRELIITEPLLDGKDFEDLCGWVHEFSQKLKLC